MRASLWCDRNGFAFVVGKALSLGVHVFLGAVVSANGATTAGLVATTCFSAATLCCDK